MHCMLMFATLAITLPANVLPDCDHLVVQWHLPPPLFVSIQDVQWEI